MFGGETAVGVSLGERRVGGGGDGGRAAGPRCDEAVTTSLL